MNTKYDFGGIAYGAADKGIVYIRAIATSDLPAEIQDATAGLDMLYAVHDARGARLALTRDRAMAFELARHNNMLPVSVH